MPPKRLVDYIHRNLLGVDAPVMARAGGAGHGIVRSTVSIGKSPDKVHCLYAGFFFFVGFTMPKRRATASAACSACAGIS